jgi:hypothetical protein
MGYSGPSSDPIRIHYPLETKAGTPDWQAIVVESNIDLLGAETNRQAGIDTAFWRGGLIGFRTGDVRGQIRRGQWVWVTRRFNARGGEKHHETPLHRSLGPRAPNVEDDEFWERFRAAITHPGVLLHIASQLAQKSLKEL